MMTAVLDDPNTKAFMPADKLKPDHIYTWGHGSHMVDDKMSCRWQRLVS